MVSVSMFARRCVALLVIPAIFQARQCGAVARNHLGVMTGQNSQSPLGRHAAQKIIGPAHRIWFQSHDSQWSCGWVARTDMVGILSDFVLLFPSYFPHKMAQTANLVLISSAHTRRFHAIILIPLPHFSVSRNTIC